MSINLRRFWVNQPSTSQLHHKLNGTLVLALDTGDAIVRVWFTEGDVVSMEMHRMALSPGWPQHLRRSRVA